jgi:hypothetical protein
MWTRAVHGFLLPERAIQPSFSCLNLALKQCEADGPALPTLPTGLVCQRYLPFAGSHLISKGLADTAVKHYTFIAFFSFPSEIMHTGNLRG